MDSDSPTTCKDMEAHSNVGPGIVCSRGCLAAPPTGGAWFRGSQGARGKDCSTGYLAIDLSGRAVGR